MTARAFAKVNLSLEVYGRRPDGFHRLRSVVQPISLCDVLDFAPAEGFSTDTGFADDLILKAVRVLGGKVGGAERQAFRISVEKHIPVGGGLGGGSADAAATLLTLNGLWGLGLGPEDLAAIGAEVGSDVPSLVLANHYRRAVLMEGRGEEVSLLPVAPGRHLVLANPGVASSTAAVYAKCAERLLPAEERVNDLQEAAVALYPEIAGALEALRKAGASEVMMSGSGATCFGFAVDSSEAETIAARLSASGYVACAAEFVQP